MRDNDDTTTTPAIPSPRRPEDEAEPSSTVEPPVGLVAAPWDPVTGQFVPLEGAASGAGELRVAGELEAVRAPGGRGRLWVAAAAVLVLVFGGVLVAVGRDGDDGGAVAVGDVAPSSAAASSESHYGPVVATPFQSAMLALRLHAGAIAEGDEAGWMAAVDPGQPALRARYEGIYRTLRALGITYIEYRPGISVPDKKNPAAFTVPMEMFYCFGGDTCRSVSDMPEIRQNLTMKEVGGKYVITAAVDKPEADNSEPTPWQAGDLVYAKGKQVIVAAAPGVASSIGRVLPVAEKAAATDEPFATTLVAHQVQYRVFLAGEKEWKTWYHGEDDDWVIGLSVPISQYGYDVVVRVETIESDELLRVTLQHEFGHVITLTGSETWRARNQWLSEGVAEYIGWAPRTATGSLRRPSVERAVSRHRPTSMIPKVPGRHASLQDGDAYYGLSHFAVDCMAQKYGRAKMFKFVRQVLIWDETYDEASREAFGLPFTTVDKGCAAWIRQKA